jgi:hypothetical protein
MYAFVPKIAAQSAAKRRAATSPARRGRAPACKDLVSILTALGTGALAAGGIAGVIAAVGYGAGLTADAYNAVVAWLYDERSAIESRLSDLYLRYGEIELDLRDGADPALEQELQDIKTEIADLEERLGQIAQAESEAASAVAA